MQRPTWFILTLVIMAWKMEVCLLLDHNYVWYLWDPSSLQSGGAAFEGDSDASHLTADTVKQGSQTSCLLSPSLLNHHHSIQLYDGSHDISPVRAAARTPPAGSDNESGSKPLLVLLLLFPVIKLLIPCCWVKCHLNCQLSLRCFGVFVFFFALETCFSDVASWIFHGFS